MYSSAHRIRRGSAVAAVRSQRRMRVLLLVLLASLPWACTHAITGDRPPNILFMLTDDQRWDAIGLGGSRHLKTPNMDRLGQEGVYFKNAFCTTALCSPSRASILSGLYAHRHGVIDNFTEYPATLQSFPRVLQAAGYDTAYIGKAHMGENNDEPRPGFNWFVTHKGQGKYFDTEFNPEERHNLIAHPKYAGVVKAMRNELRRVMRRVDLTPDHDPMPLDQGIKQELPDAKIR